MSSSQAFTTSKKMTTSPSPVKRARTTSTGTSTIKPWSNPLAETSPSSSKIKLALPARPAPPLGRDDAASAEGSRRGRDVERTQSQSSYEDFGAYERRRSPEKPRARDEVKDYGGSGSQELDHRSKPSERGDKERQRTGHRDRDGRDPWSDSWNKDWYDDQRSYGYNGWHRNERESDRRRDERYRDEWPDSRGGGHRSRHDERDYYRPRYDDREDRRPRYDDGSRYADRHDGDKHDRYDEERPLRDGGRSPRGVRGLRRPTRTDSTRRDDHSQYGSSNRSPSPLRSPPRHPKSSPHRRSPRPRSPRHSSPPPRSQRGLRPPSESPRSKDEDGEIREEEEEGELSENEAGELQADQKPLVEPRSSPKGISIPLPPPPKPINPYRPQTPPSPQHDTKGRSLVMRHRPSSSRTPLEYPPPRLPRGRPDTPPLPPDDLDAPPPPPDDAPPPTPPGPPPPSEPVDGPSGSYKPRVAPAEPANARPHEDPAHPPPAPNRNQLEPTTRASTPLPPPRTELLITGPSCPKRFTRPSLQEEMDAYGKDFQGTSSLANYDIGKKLGEGTFGVVTKGVAKVGSKPVALKKLLIHNPRDGVSVTTIREIKILKVLNHRNVVPLMDMVVEPKPGEKSNRQDIFMVFPYMDHDLCGLLGNKKFKMVHSIAKLFMQQLLEGMAYIHANNIVHRDIKTANILVNQKGEVMIADFGLARAWADTLPQHLANEYTNMVVTRWYRAPELLLGDTHYGPAVDMWSVGCVLGEMYKTEPILPGGPNDEDQMRLIAERCGPLNHKTFPNWDNLERYPGYPGMENHRWDLETPATPLYASAGQWGMDSAGLDLLMTLLRLDPAKRATADQALDHHWFWSGAAVASTETTNLAVESSHEMTTRKDPPPVPAYSQQLNEQNRQSMQQHASHRSYLPPGQPPMQMRPGYAAGGPVRPQRGGRMQPYPPAQMREGHNGLDPGPGMGAMGGMGQMGQPMSGMPPPAYPNPSMNAMNGVGMGMNGGGVGMPAMGGGHMPMNGGGMANGGGMGMNGGGPGWGGPPGGYGSNGPAWGGAQRGPSQPSSRYDSQPPRAPPTGPSGARVPPPPFKLGGAGGGAGGGRGPNGPPPLPYPSAGHKRDAPYGPRDVGGDDKRRRVQHELGDKRGMGMGHEERDERDVKKARTDPVLPY